MKGVVSDYFGFQKTPLCLVTTSDERLRTQGGTSLRGYPLIVKKVQHQGRQLPKRKDVLLINYLYQGGRRLDEITGVTADSQGEKGIVTAACV